MEGQDRRKLNSKLAQLAHIKSSIREEKSRLEKIKSRIQSIEEAQGILQTIAQQVQQTAHEQISTIVTKCLETIFENEAYQFRIQFDRKRGKTEARLTLERAGMALNDPLGEAGGGVIDIAAFALRLACLALSRPRKRLLLVLDEPFKFLSAGYRGKVSQLLVDLSEQLGVQFVMVSHSKELMIGKIVEL